MFLLGAFLAGGAVGFAADRAVTHSRPARQNNERAMGDELAKQLSLTADQRRVVDSVFAWRRARDREIMLPYQPLFDSVRNQTRPMLDSVRDSGRVLMLQVLDSAQKAQFKALIERNRRTADSMKKAREGSQ
jgi:hypothetical protein